MSSDQNINITGIPASARALTALGDETTRAVDVLFHGEQASLLPRNDVPDLRDLSEALRHNWTDAQAAELIRALTEHLRRREPVDIRALSRWALAHQDNAAAVIDCMRVKPPAEIDIIRVLSRAGSQKLVFLATWRLTQQEVVLKQLVAEPEDAQRILLRELQPHPLSMAHPNIIETHFLRNMDGEAFLVEQRLPLVLDDEWRSGGLHEAANLLSDIAHAIRYLHDNGLVHGDVKPDNIGKRGNQYILLDFGICRKREQFTREATPTGSIRTRAPELLDENAYVEPEKVDVWALGATIFNTVVGRFPLIKKDEKFPGVSAPTDRSRFEAELRTRVRTQWDRWVDLRDVPTPLREILALALARDPHERITSGELVDRVTRDLSAFLRSANSSSGNFSPLDELEQLSRYLPPRETLKLMPMARRQALQGRVRQLQSIPGFSTEQKRKLNELAAIVS